jgi:polyisoprenoid-binding protein YceI
MHRRVILLGLLSARAAAQPRALALTPANTGITFAIGALGLFDLAGRFTRLAGELRFDPAQPTATQVAVLVDTTSVEADGGGAATARSLDLLRTGDFPTMAYRSTAVALAPDGTATLAGLLTLAGVTRPLALGVRREPQAFAATGMLERGAHGLTALRPILADRVRLAITIRLDRG